jgi:hypothetical protein
MYCCNLSDFNSKAGKFSDQGTHKNHQSAGAVYFKSANYLKWVLLI